MLTRNIIKTEVQEFLGGTCTTVGLSGLVNNSSFYIKRANSIKVKENVVYFCAYQDYSPDTYFCAIDTAIGGGDKIY